MVVPPVCRPAELEAQAEAALAAFVKKRFSEGTGPYKRAFLSARRLVERLFEATDNLRRLNSKSMESQPELMEAARFLAGPPLSQDDLETLCGVKVLKRARVEPEAAAKAVEAINAFLDPFRFPWLGHASRPSVCCRCEGCSRLDGQFVGCRAV